MAAASVATAPKLLSIEKYLNTTYRPDVDYVDGHIERRNLGKFDHGDLQLQIGSLIRIRQKDWQTRVVFAARTRVSPTRVRIPDICVIEAGREREQVISHPPLLCVEVLSPRDTLNAMRERVQDYFDMGVPAVWIFNTKTRTAYDCSATAMKELKDGVLRLAGTPVELSLAEVFSTLDE